MENGASQATGNEYGVLVGGDLSEGGFRSFCSVDH